MGYIRDMILDRVSEKQEKNAMILVVGDTGSGKSNLCNSFAKLLDPTYDINRVAFMTAQRFMKILNHNKDLGRGKAINWDDAGKGLKRDEWATNINRMVRDIMQTFRIDGLIVFVNCPDASFIDKKILKLFHYWIETTNIDYEKNVQYAKFYKIQINRKTEKVYWHRPKMRDKNGNLKRIEFLCVPKCESRFEKQYKKRKLIANKELKIDVENRIDEDTKKRKIIKNDDIVKEIYDNIEMYEKKYNKRIFIDKFLISSKFDIGGWRANKIQSMVNQQYGYPKMIE